MEHQQSHTPAPNLPNHNLAVAAVVLGSITLPMAFLPLLNFIAIITGILGIVFGVISIRDIKKYADRVKGGGLALTGLLLSVSGLVIIIAMYALVLLMASAQ